MIASYCPKKGFVVNMLSTMHALLDISSTPCEKKPEVILYYSSTKGGVDILDRMVRTYTSKRMTRRWPVALFYNMLDVSAVNAYVVWQQLQDENSSFFSKKKRRKFLIQLEKGLAGMLPTNINHAALPQNKRKRAETEDQQPKPKKARCHLCDRSKDRKCKQICIACKKNVAKNIWKSYVFNAGVHKLNSSQEFFNYWYSVYCCVIGFIVCQFMHFLLSCVTQRSKLEYTYLCSCELLI